MIKYIYGDDMNLDDISIKKDLVIIFMGTPDFSASVLEGLISKYKVRAVVTQPDKPVGRGGKLKYSPIKEIALKNNILCLQPNRIKDSLQEINQLEPDLIITCAYGQILPLELLLIPKLGCINVHASLLPKLRGGAPIHRAIINGYSKTGITIMYMSKGMDEGDIISQREIPIEMLDTAETLHDKLSVLGRDLLLDTLPSIINGTNSRTPQDDSLATYGYVIKREDEKLDFSKSKREVYNKIRGLNSWPGAYTLVDGTILKVWESRITDNVFSDKLDGEVTAVYPDGFGIKVSDGEIVFLTVQPEGKTRMSASDYARGMVNKGNFVGKIFE